MSTMWRKAMLYLGLGPEEEYDDYHDPDYEDDLAPAPPSGGRARPSAPPPSGYPAPQPSEDSSAIGAVRPIRGDTTVTRVDPEPEDRRGEVARDGGQGEPGGDPAVPRPRPQAVRPIQTSPNAKPHVVVPATFNQAQEVADKFKGSQPVIVNLQVADRDLARRLIDFASGLCYGLGGQMEKVANQVYLLTPTNVEVSAEERRRLHERGYDG